MAGSVVAALAVLGIIGSSVHKSSTPPNPGTPVPVSGAANTPSGYTTFQSAADHFTIAVPDDWKTVDPLSPGAQAAMNAMEQSNPKLQSLFGGTAYQLAARGIGLMAIKPTPDAAGLAPNVNVVAQPDLTYSSDDLSKVAAGIPTELNRLGAHSTGISYTTLDGQKALRSTDVLPVTSPSGSKEDVQQAQYFLGGNGFLYALTFTGDDPAMQTIATTFSTS